jgi:HD-GYP domain-containing protein (c-di-GMP phosphodiesterase class II)
MRAGLGTSPEVVARAALRVRCDRVGVITVVCDRAGRLSEDVSGDHPGGVLLAEPIIRRAIEDLASGMSEDPRKPREVASKCWVWMVQAETRLSDLHLIAIALESGAMQEPWLLRALGACGANSDRARARVAQVAKFHANVIPSIAGLLAGSLEDLHTLAESRSAIRGFTRELSGSYETISLLYSLGRGLGDVTRPLDLVRGTCEKLLDAMPFEWAAARVSETSLVPTSVRGISVVTGRSPVPEAMMAGHADDVIQRLVGTTGCVVMDSPKVLCQSREPLFLAHPLVRERGVIGVVLIGAKTTEDPTFSSYDTQTLEAAAGYVSTFLSGSGLYEDQQQLFLGTIRALSASIDAKDKYTQGHSERVSMLSEMIALASGMNPIQAERLRIAGLVHDVGKIGVPEAVLTKQGKLTDAEFELIKAHPTIGHTILKDIPLLGDILPSVLHHHERWDGKGYPHGLAGQAIPINARIVSVADSFDAMSSTRSYRGAMDRARVLGELRRARGTQLDADLVDAFLKLDLAPYDEMWSRHESIQAAA